MAACTLAETVPPSGVAGTNVSGRPWKTIQSKPTKFSCMKSHWKDRREKTNEYKKMKEKEKKLKELEEKKKEELKAQRKEREARKLANTLKAEIVQSVSSRKVKRMSKKQFLASGIQIRPDPNAQPKVYGDIEE